MKSVTTFAALLALLAATTANAQPRGRGQAANALTPEARQAVTEALAGPDGEFAAHALYSAILEKHGDIQPYAAIREAEMRHIQALQRQLEKYGIAIPADKFAGQAVAPATLLDAAKQGVESEEKNIAMYDRFLASVKDYADLTRVFTNLQRASRDAHLPAFKAAVQSEGQLAFPKMQARMEQCPQGHARQFCRQFCWSQAGRGQGPTPVVSLPAGDPSQGKAAFSAMKCYACHTVLGHEFPAPYAKPPVPVMLGAEKQRPTPSQLAESIVNPSHALEPGYKEELIRSGKLSRMGDYSEAMTVRQLSDLVAFLESLNPGK